MKEITRSHDAFRLNLMKGLLESQGVHAVLMDEHVGGLYHGIGNMYVRLMVLEEDAARAVQILQDHDTVL